MHYLRESGDGMDRRSSQQRIRDENLKCLFNLLKKNREMSRSDMARITGLSPTTVSVLVEELLREKLAVETGYAHTTLTGRKPINLHINASGRQIPVFSLCRRGVFYALYNLQMERLEQMFVPLDAKRFGGFNSDCRECFPDAGEDYAALICDILRRQSRIFNAKVSMALCINYPGIYRSQTQRYYMPSMHVSMRRETLRALEDEMQLPIFIGSNAQSMAYAEKKHLEAMGEGVDELMYVLVRDGIGMGMIRDNMVIARKEHFSGEIGHVTINYRGAPCVCGGRGCLEHYVNTDAIIARIAQVVDLHPCDCLPREKEKLTLELIGAAYDSGEGEIVKAINEVAAQLFAGLCNVMYVTGIGRVYIGGIECLGQGFMRQLKQLAMAMEEGMRQHMEIDYGHIAMEDVGRGIAEFYIDKVFEISKRPK